MNVGFIYGGNTIQGPVWSLAKNSENVIQFLHPSLSHWSIHNHLFSFFLFVLNRTGKHFSMGGKNHPASCLTAAFCFAWL